MICSSHQRMNSSSNVAWVTLSPPSRLIKFSHLAILKSLGLLMVVDTLGQSVGTLSKNKEQSILPWTKCFIFPCLTEDSCFFIQVKSHVHQSKTFERRHSTTKIMAGQEAQCRFVEHVTLKMVKRMIFIGNILTSFIRIRDSTVSVLGVCSRCLCNPINGQSFLTTEFGFSYLTS